MRARHRCAGRGGLAKINKDKADMKTFPLAHAPGPAPRIRLGNAHPIARVAALTGALVLGLCGVGRAGAQTTTSTASAPPTAALVSGTTAADEGTDWKFTTRLSAIAEYDDNVFIQPANARSDYSLHLTPSLAFGRGNFRSEFAPLTSVPYFLVRTDEEDLPQKNFAYVGYTPEAVLYDKYTAQDTVNHDARIAARQEDDLTDLHGQLRFQKMTDTDIDVGRRLRQIYYTAEAGGEAALSGKIAAGGDLIGRRTEYSGGFSSTEGRVEGHLDYQAAPKTNVGLGAAVGRLDVSDGANQTYVQPLLEMKYQPTERISLSGQAGEEFRQFGGARSDRSQFVFAADGRYRPTESTVFTVSGRRDTQSSAQYVGENIVGTTGQGSIRQRFFLRNYLTLTGGLVHNNYEENETGPAISRRDNYQFYKIALSREVTRYGTVELSYDFHQNDSTISQFGFTQNIVGVAASFFY